MDATPSTNEHPNCNTWTCPTCGDVKPEAGSAKLYEVYHFEPEEFDDWEDDSEDNEWDSAVDRDLRYGQFNKDD